MQEDYWKSVVYFCKCPGVFLRSFVSALFLSFFSAQSICKSTEQMSCSLLVFFHLFLVSVLFSALSILNLRLRDTERGVWFPSTSTCSSSCTVDLPGLKTTQYEASDTGKHCKSREIHNLCGRVLTEAATTRFFSSEI